MPFEPVTCDWQMENGGLDTLVLIPYPGSSKHGGTKAGILMPWLFCSIISGRSFEKDAEVSVKISRLIG